MLCNKRLDTRRQRSTTRRVLSPWADLGGNDHRQDRRGPPRGLTLWIACDRCAKQAPASRENHNVLPRKISAWRSLMIAARWAFVTRLTERSIVVISANRAALLVPLYHTDLLNHQQYLCITKKRTFPRRRVEPLLILTRDSFQRTTS